jgi:hypothetical protein
MKGVLYSCCLRRYGDSMVSHNVSRVFVWHQYGVSMVLHLGHIGVILGMSAMSSFSPACEENKHAGGRVKRLPSVSKRIAPPWSEPSTDDCTCCAYMVVSVVRTWLCMLCEYTDFIISQRREIKYTLTCGWRGSSWKRSWAL